MARSRITRSGEHSSNRSSAWRPFSALTTTCPSRLMMWLRTRRLTGSSSTTSTVDIQRLPVDATNDHQRLVIVLWATGAKTVHRGEKLRSDVRRGQLPELVQQVEQAGISEELPIRAGRFGETV